MDKEKLELLFRTVFLTASIFIFLSFAAVLLGFLALILGG